MEKIPDLAFKRWKTGIHGSASLAVLLTMSPVNTMQSAPSSVTMSTPYCTFSVLSNEPLWISDI